MKMFGGETHSPLLPRLQVSLYMCVPPHWEIMTWQTDVGGDYFWDSLPRPNVMSSSFRSLCFRERLCAFCYCGSRSLLGQGDLQVFSITPQLEALFSHEDGGGSASDSSDGDQTTQPNMPGETTSGQRDKTESVRYSKLTFLSMQIALYVCLKLCLLYLLTFSLCYTILTGPIQTLFSVGLQTVRKNLSEPVDFGMSCLTLAFLNISTSSLSLSPVKASTPHWSELLQIHNENGTHECSICLIFSGQCWAHQSCALWSEGVFQGEGQSLLNVDRAIYSGSTKVSQTRTLVH